LKFSFQKIPLTTAIWHPSVIRCLHLCQFRNPHKFNKNSLDLDQDSGAFDMVRLPPPFNSICHHDTFHHYLPFSN